MTTIKFPQELIDAISVLEPTVRCEIYDAVVNYVKNGEFPSDMSAVAKALITLAKPLIDKANRLQKVKPLTSDVQVSTNTTESSETKYYQLFKDSPISDKVVSILFDYGINRNNVSNFYISASNAGALDKAHMMSTEEWEKAIIPTLTEYAKSCKSKHKSIFASFHRNADK